MSHTCLLGFKSILCAGHWSVRRLFVTSMTCVLLAAWRGVLSFANIISRLKRIWRKRTGRMTSFGCHIAFMFPWMHFLFVYMEVLVRVLLCSFFAIFKVFNTTYKTIHEEYFPTNKRQLHCHARESRALSDRSMCIIQNNQILDVDLND